MPYDARAFENLLSAVEDERTEFLRPERASVEGGARAVDGAGSYSEMAKQCIHCGIRA